MAKSQTVAPVAPVAPAAPAAPATITITALQAMRGMKSPADSRFGDFFASEATGFVNSLTQIAGRTFAGAGAVWSGSLTAGALDGETEANRIVREAMIRAGLNPDATVTVPVTQ